MMDLHVALRMVLMCLDAEEQDIVERLCAGDWERVTWTEQAGRVYIDNRPTVFVFSSPEEEPLDPELEKYFLQDEPAPLTEVLPQVPVEPAVVVRYEPERSGQPHIGLENEPCVHCGVRLDITERGRNCPALGEPVEARGGCDIEGAHLSHRLFDGQSCWGKSEEVKPRVIVDSLTDVQQAVMDQTLAESLPDCGCGCGKKVINKPGGRVKRYATDACRTRANTAKRKAEAAAKEAPTTPVPTPELEQAVETPEEVLDEASERDPGVARPIPAPEPEPTATPKCGRCDQEGHWVIDCQYGSRAQALKALGKDKAPTRIKAPQEKSVKAPAPVKAHVDKYQPAADQKAVDRIFVEGLPHDVTDEVLGQTANALREKYKDGYQHAISYSADVLALYGVTEELLESALKNPQRVEVRPESFDKVKRYPVLGFFRGDVCVIVGMRDPVKPLVIAAYVGSLLAHDEHRVGHTGGGGAKRDEGGVPTTPRKVIQRLRAMGAVIEQDTGLMDDGTARVLYQGQDLGKIETGDNTPRLTCQASFQRMQRKMHAIDRRETAGVGGRS